jgi:DNA invertase Pin-like site-specific DNA recombinase
MTPALYARYSTENQRETSIADQLRLLNVALWNVLFAVALHFCYD